MTPPLSVSVFTAPEKAVVGERPRPLRPPMAFDPMTSTLIFGENRRRPRRHPRHRRRSRGAGRLGCPAPPQPHHDRLDPRAFTTSPGSACCCNGSPTPGPSHAEVGGADAQAVPAAAVLPQVVARAAAVGVTLPEPCDATPSPRRPRSAHHRAGPHQRPVDSTSLHVPSDRPRGRRRVPDNQCHMYVGAPHPRAARIGLPRWTACAGTNPKIAVAGHKKTGAPDSAGGH